MKNLKSLLTFMFIMAVASIAYGQTTDPEPGTVDILGLLMSPGGILALSVIVTGWITKAIQTSGIASQVISWVVPMGLCFVADAKGSGDFAVNGVVYTIVVGFGLGLVGNALYDMGALKSILAAFFAKK